MFNQTLRARQHHLSNLDMVRGQLVKGRVDDLAADQRTFHIGDLLRPFIDQQHDQLHLRIVLLNRIGDFFEQDGFARLRRCHDQASLSLTDRRDQIDEPHRKILRAVLQAQPLVWEYRRQVLKIRSANRRTRLISVDRHNIEQRTETFPLLWQPRNTADLISGL